MGPEPLKPKTERTPRIPGYRLEGVLGRGSTGVVYRARQLSVDRVVAVKILHPELVGTARATSRLQREARTTARLGHPNIISAIDMGEIGGVWWYAMELVDGESLSERLESGGRLSEREVLKLFIPLCDALQHAYENGVVHRDIKPANILIEKQKRALLVDLGLAFVEDDPGLTRLGGTLGTPHYISPEQARNSSDADAKSDIWSLGATMYHCLCGRPPFAGQSVAEILSSVLYSRIEDPQRLAPNISKGIALVLRKCLTRDPERRYQRPNELAADLERIRERRQVKVEPRSLDPVMRRPHPRVRAAAVVAALFVIVMGAIFWIRPPWGAGSSPADTPDLEQSWAPLEEIADLVVAEAANLARAWTGLTAMYERLPERHRARWSEIQSELSQQLDEALWATRHELEPRLRKVLLAGDFGAAAVLMERTVPQELARATGFEPQSLPEGFRLQFDTWRSGLRQDYETELERALERVDSGLALYWEGLLQEANEAQGQNLWRDAESRLAESVTQWFAPAGVRVQGLPTDEREALVARWSFRLEQERKRLGNRWWDLDGRLRRSVAQRAVSIDSELGSSLAAEDALASYDAWFESELASLGLGTEQMPRDLEGRALEEYRSRRARLAGRVGLMSAANSQSSWVARESELEALWAERRYAEVATACENHLTDPNLVALRGTIELRRLEAQLLEDLLAQISQELVRRDGRELDLRIGSITVLGGRLRAGPDPLSAGFRLELESIEYRLNLRRVSGGGSVLALEDLERLAGLSVAAARSSPKQRVLLALLRFHEGRFAAAEKALNAGEAPSADVQLDALERDLTARLAAAIERLSQVTEERAVFAEKELAFLRREGAAPHAREESLRRARILLKEYEEVLSEQELEELRSIRRSLERERQPVTSEDFQRLFEPTAVKLLSNERVRMDFEFGGRRESAWDSGDWRDDGAGWIALKTATSDAKMLSRRSPRLVLREPLDLDARTLRVVFVIEQPEDSPPDLLLLSAAGFHVAFAGSSGSEPARCLAGTQDPEELVRRIRAGEGRSFEGLRQGTRHELELLLHRIRGTVEVGVDGKALYHARLGSPIGRSESSSLALRSREPLRLVAVSFEGARHRER